MPKITYTGNTETAPNFIGDFLNRDYLLAGGVKLGVADFPAFGSVRATVGAAGALAGATSVPVAALSGAIPAGTTLDFGGAKFARLTAPAAAGATTLTVAALPTALVSGDTALYAGTSGKKTVIAGTRIGRTFAERDTDAFFGPAADADDEVLIVAYDVIDAGETNDAEVLRKGTLIKENLLPGWATETAALKAKVRAVYETTRGGGI
ncbi:MAG TPA: hypothetical protein VNI84_21080 [Pyrinomonadaceae bacterium]|nr:hypothetical protein [Pyrinomonadaceae bacterium]